MDKERVGPAQCPVLQDAAVRSAWCLLPTFHTSTLTSFYNQTQVDVEGSSSPSPNVKLDQTPCRSSCQRHVLTRLHEQSTLLLSREPSQVSRTGLLSRTFTQVPHRLRPSGLSSQSVRVSKASFIQLASDACSGLRLTVVSAPPCRTEAVAWSSATVETEGSVSWLPPSSSAQTLSSVPDNLTQTASWCWWIILMLPEVFYFYFKH